MPSKTITSFKKGTLTSHTKNYKYTFATPLTTRYLPYVVCLQASRICLHLTADLLCIVASYRVLGGLSQDKILLDPYIKPIQWNTK